MDEVGVGADAHPSPDLDVVHAYAHLLDTKTSARCAEEGGVNQIRFQPRGTCGAHALRFVKLAQSPWRRFERLCLFGDVCRSPLRRLGRRLRKHPSAQCSAISHLDVVAFATRKVIRNRGHPAHAGFFFAAQHLDELPFTEAIFGAAVEVARLGGGG